MDFRALAGSDEQAAPAVKMAPAPIKASPLDVDVATKRFQLYGDKVQEMVVASQALAVDSEQAATTAVENAAQAKRLFKKIEDMRKKVIAPAQAFVKGVNAFAKTFTDPLGQVESRYKMKLGQYQHQVELERRKAEEAARKAQEELQARLDAEAKAAGVEAPKVVSIPIKAPTGPTRSQSGAAVYSRQVWRVEVLEPDKVDRVFCSPDPRRLQEAVDAGIREIAGCRVYQQTITSLRS